MKIKVILATLLFAPLLLATQAADASTIRVQVPTEMDTSVDESLNAVEHEYFIDTTGSVVGTIVDNVNVTGVSGWSISDKVPSKADTKELILTLQNQSLVAGDNPLSLLIPKDVRSPFQLSVQTGASTVNLPKQKAAEIRLDYDYTQEDFNLTLTANGNVESSEVHKNGDIVKLPTSLKTIEGRELYSWEDASGNIFLPGSDYVMKIGDQELVANYQMESILKSSNLQIPANTTKVVFTDVDVPDGVTETILEADKNGPVRGYSIDSTYYVTSKGNGKVYAPESANGMFANSSDQLKNLVSIDFSNFTTELTTSMNDMFQLSNIKGTLDLSPFDTSNVTSMHAMFYGMPNVTDIDMNTFDTRNVTDMTYMFSRLQNVATLDLSSFELAKDAQMPLMFAYSESLERIFVSKLWDASNIANGGSMFTNLTAKFKGPGEYWKIPYDERSANYVTGNLTLKQDVKLTFEKGAEPIETYPYHTVTLPEVNNEDGSFGAWMIDEEIMAPGETITFGESDMHATAVAATPSLLKSNDLEIPSGMTDVIFTDIKQPATGTANHRDLGVLKTGPVRAWSVGTKYYISSIGNGEIIAPADMSNMFTSSLYVETIDFTNLNTSQVTNMHRLFYNAWSVTSVNLELLDTSNVISMKEMFMNAKSLTSLNFSRLDTSNVTDMSRMFDTSAFTSLDLSSFDTSRVTNMDAMFNNMANLKTLNVSSFNTSNVTSMSYTFRDLKSLTTLDLSSFDTSNVKDMSTMFYGTSFKELDLSSFSTKSVTDASGMFMQTKLERIYVSDKWVGVPSNSTMFHSSTKLKGPVEYDSPSALYANYKTGYLTLKKPVTMTFEQGAESVGTYPYYSVKLPEYVGPDAHLFAGWMVNGEVKLPGESVKFEESDIHVTVATPTPATLKSNDLGIPAGTTDIIFTDEQQPVAGTTNNKDLGLLKTGPVKAWSVGSKYYVSSLGNGKVIAPTIMSGMFSSKYSLKKIDFTNLDTSQVTEMASLFAYSPITDMNIELFDTSNVTDMRSMFGFSYGLTSLDLSTFDTSRVQNMGQMFVNMNQLTHLDVSNFNTQNVTNMTQMFSGVTELKTLDLSHFNTTNVTQMQFMFYNTTSLESLDLSYFNTANVTNMGSMFSGTGVLQSLDVASFNTEKVTYMHNMFKGIGLTELDISSFDTKLVSLYNEMFLNTKLERIFVSDKWTGTSSSIKMFTGSTKLKGPIIYAASRDTAIYANYKTGYLTLKKPVTVTFEKGAESIDTYPYYSVILPEYVGLNPHLFAGWVVNGDVKMPGETVKMAESDIHVSVAAPTPSTLKVADLGIPAGTTDVIFTDEQQPKTGTTNNKDLGVLKTGPVKAWSVGTKYYISSLGNGKVIAPTDMSSMFASKSTVQTIDFTNLDTSQVTNMGNLFYNASALVDVNIEVLDTSNVTSMSQMFGFTRALTSLDLTQLDTSKVTNMSHMFYNASGLKSLDLSHFNTSNVTSMVSMFNGANSLTALDLSSFDTRNVTQMQNMFENMPNLQSLDVTSFNTEKVTYMYNMFKGIGLTELDISSFDTKLVSLHNEMFLNTKLERIFVSDKWTGMSSSIKMFTGSTKLKGPIIYAASRDTAIYANYKTGYLTLKKPLTVSFDGAESIETYPYYTVTLPEYSGDQAFGGWVINGDVKWPGETFKMAESDIHVSIAAPTPSTLKVVDLGIPGNTTDVIFTDMKQPETGTLNNKDLGVLKTGPVKAWSVGTKYYISSLGNGKIIAPTNMNSMFASNATVETIDFSNLDTSQVTHMTQLFYSARKLANVNIEVIDTSNVTDMSMMFGFTRALKTIDLSKLNTSNVKTMAGMFVSSGVTHLDLTAFDTRNVTAMHMMFQNATALTTVDLSSFDTSNVTSMSSMFYLTKLKELDLSSFSSASLIGITDMFKDTALERILVSDKWVDIKGSSASMSVFAGSTKLKGPMNYNSSKVTAAEANYKTGYLTLKKPIVMSFEKGADVIETYPYYTITLPQYSGDTPVFDGWLVNGAIKQPGETFKMVDSNIHASIAIKNPSHLKVADLGIPYGMEDIIFTDVVQPTSGTSNNKDLGVVDKGPVRAWSVGKKYYISSMGNGKIIAPTDMSSMFAAKTSIKTIDFANLDTSQVENMSSLFYGASALTSVNVERLDTSNVTDMSQMFRDVKALTTLDVRNFKTSKVSNMSYMFHSMFKLTSLNLDSFDTRNVTTMSNMFGLLPLTSLDLQSFNTSNVSDMSNMFFYMSELTSLNVQSFDTSNVTTMRNMFQNVKSLTTLDLQSFKTSKVTDMASMFLGMTNLESLDLQSFDTSNVTTMEYMFRLLENIQSLDVSSFNTENVTDVKSMFSNIGLRTINLSSFSPKKMSNLTGMFANTKLERIFVSEKWTGFTGNQNALVFDNSKDLTGPINYSGAHASYANYKTGYLTLDKPVTMSFDGAESITTYYYHTITLPEYKGTGSFGGWVINGEYYQPGDSFKLEESNVHATVGAATPSNLKLANLNIPSGTTEVIFTNSLRPLTGVTNYRDMGERKSGPVRAWSVGTTYYISSMGNGKVIAPPNMSSMFDTTVSNGSKTVNTIDFTNLDTSQVTNMAKLFNSASRLTNVNLEVLNTSNVTDMSMMFASTQALKTVDLSKLDTSNVTTMATMFSATGLTDIDLSHFDTRKVTSMDSMFNYSSSVTSINLSSFDTSNVVRMQSMFSNTRLKELDLSSFSSNNASLTDMFKNTSLERIYVSDKWVVTGSVSMFSGSTKLKGPIDFVSSKITAQYANYKTGYFTLKKPLTVSFSSGTVPIETYPYHMITLPTYTGPNADQFSGWSLDGVTTVAAGSKVTLNESNLTYLPMFTTTKSSEKMVPEVLQQPDESSTIESSTSDSSDSDSSNQESTESSNQESTESSNQEPVTPDSSVLDTPVVPDSGTQEVQPSSAPEAIVQESMISEATQPITEGTLPTHHMDGELNIHDSTQLE